MKIFQTPTGAKKNIWHIFSEYYYSGSELRSVNSICNAGTYWYNGYHDNKPEQNKHIESEFDGTQKLCPACVLQGYKQGFLDVIEKKKV